MWEAVEAWKPTERRHQVLRAAVLDRLDPRERHLLPFFERGLAYGSLTRDSAKELLEAFFVKFNNHTAPSKVGVVSSRPLVQLT